MKTKLIELIGAPGAGKSTTASAIFSELKTRGINAELVTEVAKEWAWEGRSIDWRNQTLLAATQLHRFLSAVNKADVIVTDGSLTLSHWYASYYGLRAVRSIAAMKDELKSVTTSYEYFIKRDKPYNAAGRFHSEDESNEVERLMEHYYHIVTTTTKSSTAVADILEDLKVKGVI